MQDKGFSVLETLIFRNLTDLIKIVVIGTDKKVKNDYSNQIKELCVKNDINWVYRNDFKDTEIGEISIAISWNRLISLENTKLIVLHESLLPKYRGFAPLVNQLINKHGFSRLLIYRIFLSMSCTLKNYFLVV